MLKNCMTCAHRKGIGFNYSKCMVTGYFCEVERKYPSYKGCDRSFNRWEPKTSIVAKIINIFRIK